MVKLFSQTCFGHVGLCVLGPVNELLLPWAPPRAACREQSAVSAYRKANTDHGLRSSVCESAGSSVHWHLHANVASLE